ncbi:MAG: homoserine dehydrogenase, partial [Clostridia bacterium]|nr:homoserine dehydrogenase [Clostridia bacterium]
DAYEPCDGHRAQDSGIMNGTTNYILTRMKDDGVSFDEALTEAKRLGYAEADPTADVDGIDAQRKIIILSAVTTDMLAAESQVYTETMTKISTLDMDAASRWGGTVKLIGSYRNLGDKMALYVCPRFVPFSDPIASINDVYNGIKLTLEMTSDVMYYGRGAGSYPTASAMVSDVVSIMTGAVKAELHMRWHKAEEDFVVPFEGLSFKYYIRTSCDSAHDAEENAKLVIGDVRTLAGSPKGYAEFITGEVGEAKMREIASSGPVGSVESLIRILD